MEINKRIVMMINLLNSKKFFHYIKAFFVLLISKIKKLVKLKMFFIYLHYIECML